MSLAFEASASETASIPDRQMPASAAVAVNGVAKHFGGMVAVEDISFTVKRGSFVTLLGPSGSGKTTILRMIAGFIYPSAGEIVINGRPISTVPPYKRSIGVVFQSLALFPHMTVAQNVAYPLKCRRFDKREIPDRVSRYLNLVQLSGFERRRVDQLSGGQRQRVAIARALVYEPDLLLLDEPLAALDKKLREEIQLEFLRIQSELQVTTINVTHDQREALVMSDEIIVLSGGRIQQKGAPSAIYRSPANRFVASFIGHTNVLAGRVARVEGRMISLDFGGAALTLPLPEGGAAPEAGQQAECALRAERTRIGRLDGDLRATDIKVPGRVLSVAYEGDRILYEVALGDDAGARIKIIRHDCVDDIAQGEAVSIGWQAEDVVVLGSHSAH
jgi:putative spermidine/putrescine transport system ATP-binding protein